MYPRLLIRVLHGLQILRGISHISENISETKTFTSPPIGGIHEYVAHAVRMHNTESENGVFQHNTDENGVFQHNKDESRDDVNENDVNIGIVLDGDDEKEARDDENEARENSVKGSSDIVLRNNIIEHISSHIPEPLPPYMEKLLMLLKADANLNSRDSEGLLAVDYARLYGDWEILKLLEKLNPVAENPIDTTDALTEFSSWLQANAKKLGPVAR